ncbi:MAG: PEP-utilizing enzyme [Candidatus Woesearchaeota archaeon]
MKINPNKYEELFRIESVTSYFCSELFMFQYSKLNCLVIQDKNTWESFLPKEVIQTCLEEGLKLFSSKNNFNKYIQECSKYQKEGKLLLKKYTHLPKVLTKEQFQEIAEVTKRIWVYKHKDEFYYSDLAYQKAKEEKHKILNKNLVILERIKTEQREIHTKFFFGNNALLNRVLLKIGLQFKINKRLTDFLSYQNILDLFENGKINLLILKKRKKCYALMGRNGKILPLGQKESLILSKAFIKNQTNTNIKGVVACKGIVEGRAVVVPTKIKFTEKTIKNIFNKMKKGDILIAHTTSPEITLLCHKAGAIVTDQGGLGSHAAIISREFKIPCIVGTKYATQFFKTGEIVIVNANQGIIHKKS